MANERRVSAAKALEIICASSDNDSDDLSSCDNDSGSDFIPECDISDLEDNIETMDIAVDSVDDDNDEVDVSESTTSCLPNTEYVARSGRHWLLTSPTTAQVRRRPANIVRDIPGPKGDAAMAASMVEMLKAFLSDDMIELIVRHTNDEGRRVVQLWNEQHLDDIKEFQATCVQEIWALIGLMFLRGIYLAFHEPVKELWSSLNGRAVFAATMSRNRFQYLLQIIRFDDKATRDERRAADNFAPIRELFDLFNNRCRDNYTLSERVTIDETLRKFRGRCKFRVYMPQKPGKYGLLFRVLTDSRERYVSRLLPYTGKATNDNVQQKQSPASIVLNLCQHLRGSGRNITIDRYYTSVDLAEELLKNYNLTVVGTINTNRQHIPSEMKSVVGREVLSTRFAWSDQVMMLSYVPKPRKNVLLLSTEHDQPDISGRDDRKPEVILAYNEDKGGVDIVDKMIDTYRTKVTSNRWPMAVFYTILDIAALNAFVVWLNKNKAWMQKKGGQRRRLFLHELGTNLVLPWVEQRSLNVVGLKSDTLRAMSTVLNRPVEALMPAAMPAPANVVPRRCAICIQEAHGKGYKRAKNAANKVKQRCHICSKPSCMKHSRKVNTIVCGNCDM
jgi:hypothetical protein